MGSEQRTPGVDAPHQSISRIGYDSIAGMDYQEAVEYTVSLFVLVAGVIILTNPVLGYLQSLPGSVFEWTFGGASLS